MGEVHESRASKVKGDRVLYQGDLLRLRVEWGRSSRAVTRLYVRVERYGGYYVVPLRSNAERHRELEITLAPHLLAELRDRADPLLLKVRIAPAAKQDVGAWHTHWLEVPPCHPEGRIQEGPCVKAKREATRTRTESRQPKAPVRVAPKRKPHRRR